MHKPYLAKLTGPVLARCGQVTLDNLEAQAVEVLQASLGVFGGCIDPITLLCRDARLSAEGPLGVALRGPWEASRDPGAGFLLAMMPSLTLDGQLRLIAEASAAHPERVERMAYVFDGLFTRTSLEPEVVAALAHYAQGWTALARILLRRYGSSLATASLPALVRRAREPLRRFSDTELQEMPLAILVERLRAAEESPETDHGVLAHCRSVLAARPDSPYSSLEIAFLDSSRESIRDVGLKRQAR